MRPNEKSRVPVAGITDQSENRGLPRGARNAGGMTDKPIIFSGPMIRALLDGRKTQTRNILSPKSGIGPAHRVERICGAWMACEYDRRWPLRLPHAPGDRLWVREAWRVHHRFDASKPSDIHAIEGGVWFEADDPLIPIHLGKCRPSIFMPRWASRLTLVVTDVRVQRVQEISEEDAKAEGIEYDDDRSRGNCIAWRDYLDRGGKCAYSIGSFRSIWDSLNAKRGFGWDANPWVVATTFTVHRCNIDQMEDTQ